MFCFKLGQRDFRFAVDALANAGFVLFRVDLDVGFGADLASALGAAFDDALGRTLGRTLDLALGRWIFTAVSIRADGTASASNSSCAARSMPTSLSNFGTSSLAAIKP